MNPLFASTVAAAILSSSSWAFADDKQECISASEGAQKQRDDRHLTKAREQFLVCSRDVCPGAVRKDCIEAMADIDKRMPSVVVRAKDGKGMDLVTVSVTIDGKLAADTLDGKSIRLDPGVHQFSFETPGQTTIDQKVVVAEGEHDRSVVITFGATQTSAAAEPEKKGAPIGAFVVIGAGVVSAGVGAVFYALGLGQRSTDLSSGCGATQTACDDEKSSIKTKLVVGDILTGVGIVGVVGGVIWAVVHYTSGPSTKEAPSPAAFRTRLDFAAQRGGGVMSVGYSF